MSEVYCKTRNKNAQGHSEQKPWDAGASVPAVTTLGISLSM
jgi:hypothetical protein